MDAKRIREMIEDMKKITMLTGEISSIHKINLENWCYVAFDHVKSVEIKYDLTKDYHKDIGHNYVDFQLQTSADQDSETFKKRCEVLTEWVKDLFWDSIVVKVSINNIERYPIDALQVPTTKDKFGDT